MNNCCNVVEFYFIFIDIHDIIQHKINWSRFDDFNIYGLYDIKNINNLFIFDGRVKGKHDD